MAVIQKILIFFLIAYIHHSHFSAIPDDSILCLLLIRSIPVLNLLQRFSVLTPNEYKESLAWSQFSSLSRTSSELGCISIVAEGLNHVTQVDWRWSGDTPFGDIISGWRGCCTVVVPVCCPKSNQYGLLTAGRRVCPSLVWRCQRLHLERSVQAVASLGHLAPGGHKRLARCFRWPWAQPSEVWVGHPPGVVPGARPLPPLCYATSYKYSEQ